jgi:hypothetical protein
MLPSDRWRYLRCVLAAALLLQCGASAAHGQRRGVSGPYLVRITGYLGPKLERPILLTSWKVNRGRDIYDLRVIKLDVLTGNIAYFNIVNALEPYSPAFEIAGDDKGVAEFVATPAGQPMVIIGSLRINPAARILMISTAERTSFSTPSASP